MLMIKRTLFPPIAAGLREEFKKTPAFLRGNWQGVSIKDKPEMAVHELLHVTIEYDMRRETDLDYYRRQVNPNLPWADDHFEERVCGYPLNPGTQWKYWPWGQSADKFRDKTGLFNHNYMERYWPKWAGVMKTPTITQSDFLHPELSETVWEIDNTPPNQGIRGRYGDLNDVVEKLVHTPTTRQAILPIYFPEDTAIIEGRQPCSMYYHFLMAQDNRLDVVYPMRSCDFIRHFADDVYMTIRLLLWVIERAGERNPYFRTVKPGRFVMHIANLHMFRNDHLKMFG